MFRELRAVNSQRRVMRSLHELLMDERDRFRGCLLGLAVGDAIGTAVAVAIAVLAQKSSAAVAVSPVLVLTLAFVTLMMCIGASLISIRKVLGVDAATVFR